MNDLQLAWSKRQKKYIEEISEDLDHLTLGSNGHLQNEKLDSVELNIEIKNACVHWWQFWRDSTKTVTLKTQISINGIVDNLIKERRKAEELYNKVQTKDFTTLNCKYCIGLEDYGYNAGHCKRCNYECETRFQPKNEEEILSRPYTI